MLRSYLPAIIFLILGGAVGVAFAALIGLGAVYFLIYYSGYGGISVK